jgi:probable O-glycosylation ligase (exosortase A-associated)
VKQTAFMIAATLIGCVGAFAIEPFVGVAVYDMFAVLRPQYLWEWALPSVGWSGYVAYTTIAATLWLMVTSGQSGDSAGTAPKQRFSFGHITYFLFGGWVCLTYFTALNQNVAWQWFLEYLKLFLMFGIATLVVKTLRHLWQIYLVVTCSLIYIAWEINIMYLLEGRMDIYHRGYGGLDNNGAGLMLAMGVPLAIHAWEAASKWWRWGFLAAVPVLLHAVLMSYSRGAMVSLALCTPLLISRSRKRKQFTLAFILLLATVPYLAGQEIRDEFFTVEDYQNDESANARFDSWTAAFKIANDYPVFGVGIRNANLLSFQYGADMEGRTIHSQYLQTAADNGWVGLALYLLALGSAWFAALKTRRALRPRTDPEANMARSLLGGIQGSLAVFCVGAVFLSLEVFELPYILGFLAVQFSLLLRLHAPGTSAAVVPDATATNGGLPAPHPMLS